MKNLYRAFVGVTVIGLLLFNSCTPEDVVVEDLSINLTSGSWNFNNLETGEGNLIDEGYKIIYSGNVINFSSDGTCTDTLLSVNGSGTWSLNANQSVLTLRITYDDGDTRNETWNIKTISTSQLVYTFNIAPNTLEMSYTH